MLEDGAYNRLIDQCYHRERPLPADVRECYKLARANTLGERKAVDAVLKAFFKATDRGFVQKRIEKEIERYADKKNKARKGATASVKARREKAEQNAAKNLNERSTDVKRTFNEGLTDVERTLNGGLTHQSPDTKHQTPKEKKTEPLVRQKKLTQLPNDFEITETHQQLADKLGLKLQAEFEHFRDHAKATGRTQANWSLAFCVWLRNARRFSGTKDPAPIDYEALQREADARELAHAER